MKVETWAGDIASIGAIYPFDLEVVLFILGLILWIAWFIVQKRMEDREYREEMSLPESEDNKQ